jgi:hypothetical protein
VSEIRYADEIPFRLGPDVDELAGSLLYEEVPGLLGRQIAGIASPRRACWPQLTHRNAPENGKMMPGSAKHS